MNMSSNPFPIRIQVIIQKKRLLLEGVEKVNLLNVEYIELFILYPIFVFLKPL